ncbi:MULTISPECIES: hypothetical protein [Streptomyces]|uniref:Uncharacterized protein n=1 Tax=Streptomyces lasiicapitis TaxID=1923961 RepID=A0ABQ2MQR5_9ACTN|nr:MULTISPECIES: hypothetical protein [Streptomyces]QIB45363.1 hypothetical protein G3H79_22125 [Streptomyces aureoverticillatus]GGO56107.1 hypothetical protein GCM10012286_69810 [Streptomyces lasiicapitis]
MTEAEDYDHLRHLIDRLPPEKLRHLRAVVDTDPEIAVYVADEALPPAAERPGFAAFAGMGRSGHTDTARSHRELTAEWSDENR